MSNSANQLVVAEREEMSRCIRTLLVRPLLTERSDPAVFDLVRRRRDPLTHWFDYHCGWTLAVEPRLGYARLLKVGGDADASRPARRTHAGGAPFDRRRYVLLCLTAAELLSVPVTTIGLLADQVVRAASADEALPAFDTAQRSERVAFVDVLRLLESYGALRTVDGTTDSFADSAEAKVLYRVEASVLMRLPAAPCGPSRLAVPATGVPAGFDALLAGLVRERRYGLPGTGETADDDGVDTPLSPVQRDLWLRHSVLRRLFDQPVVHRDELSDGELGYLASPTGRQTVRRAAEQAGFVLEERAEGVLLVDPDAIATDSRFPDDANHAKVAALLLLDVLNATPAGCAPEQLAFEADRLLDRFPRWGKAYRTEGGAAALAEDAVRVLADFRLVRHEGGRVVPRPAAARYRVTSATLKEEHSA
ncbi:TIGR02678 family protein [Streptomyces fulvorobeus]|uniref:Uncharacterized protein (TIGR02678 family) n=1 Tax=Streptomyces fulvorobeus TaxID=284028 RepID=A0A7J0CD14_9ACTN|nr:TIGR02678 family protein [Streptomyces fulvorobeus]NYE43917.1 uncharacterized protein (TIGR02678 family) [Streptomyces fulvorobeus]GFN00416.1 hypothetical protein Sfulv_52260 [Streptomyces fulvorobeus]